MIRKLTLAVLAGLMALAALAGPQARPANAAGETWADVVTEMSGILEESWGLYQDGQIKEAKAEVDQAYYGYYEKLGFEKVVMAHISGQSASAAEYEFALIKKEMSAEDHSQEVRDHIDQLLVILEDQASQLDGSSQSAWQTLVEALIVILREGFEAILVLGAIIAYLIKSGYSSSLRIVYAGAGLALLASAGLAIAINAIAALGGANQEITEGVTVLIAMVMLVWVSNWILAKSEAGAWSHYIQTKTAASVSRGSVYSLAAVAFLAVFREGAETILLYQALRARAGSAQNMLWLGLGIGAVLLVGVYLAIRYLSIRIPLRPFFLATSGVLAVLAVSFAGSGIKELQEGGVVSVTPISGAPSIDLLGIYPSAETLGAQGLVLVAMVVLGFLAVIRGRRQVQAAAAADAAGADSPVTEADSSAVGAASQATVAAGASAKTGAPGSASTTSNTSPHPTPTTTETK
ncbi:MAG: FTR1 family iron permease [Bifidobacteriaceae bacterium]|jgi:high-affinity iron transporter|nr:FTR1 family iron permease [Bifidobacteriaceae bacterium]